MSELLSLVVSTAFVASFVKIALPYALAALGGACTEGAGVIDLALEAKLLFGAFTASAVTIATGSPTLGIVGGMAAGAAVSGLQVALAVGLRADHVIVGVGLNLLALGGQRFLLQLLYGQSANSPNHPTVASGWANPILWIAIAAAIAVPLALKRTRWGLRLRAAGDRPEALAAVGVSPLRARLAAALVGGALVGVGGTALSLTVGTFAAGASAGRGYVALSMVILAGWRPLIAVIASAGFAAAIALADRVQLVTTVLPRQLTPLLPFVLTLVVLVVYGGSRRRPPRALGHHDPD